MENLPTRDRVDTISDMAPEEIVTGGPSAVWMRDATEVWRKV
jgi:hypothetical protein